MNRCAAAFLLFFLLAPLVSAGDKGEKTLRAGALLSLESTPTEEQAEPYRAVFRGYLDASPRAPWLFRLQADVTGEAVRLDELWGQYAFDDRCRLRFGLFENSLLMEDAPGAGAFSAEGGRLRERLERMGWYSGNSMGARYSGEGEVLEGSAEFFFISNSSEILLRGDLSRPVGGGRAGLSLAYYPHLFHNMWGEPTSSHSSESKTFSIGTPRKRGVYEVHYFLADLYWGKLTDEPGLIYKAELTGGNNLSDPAGVLAYGGDDDSLSFFLGGDLLVGRVWGGEAFTWTPGLNLSLICENLEEPKRGSFGILLGNRWVWNNRLSLFLDSGVELTNYYESRESERRLMTGAEARLSLRGEYRF